VKDWSIDSQLGVFRVDKTDGTPLATLWNFAIHGICYEEDSFKQSADVSGRTNELIEQKIGGVALFVNSDAGDTNPKVSEMCRPPDFLGARLISEKALSLRSTIVPQANLKLKAASKVKEMGDTHMNLTFERIANCTEGGPFNICTICNVIKCTADLRLNASWVENTPRFTGISLAVGGKRAVIASIPGEALLELGNWIRADSRTLGFDTTFLFGYSNNYLGYFAPPREYVLGGYESVLTMWGINTAVIIREQCMAQMQAVV